MILAQPIQGFAKYKRGCLTTREIASFSVFIRTPIGTWVSNIQFSKTCFSFETSSLKGLFLFRLDCFYYKVIFLSPLQKDKLIVDQVSCRKFKSLCYFFLVNGNRIFCQSAPCFPI